MILIEKERTITLEHGSFHQGSIMIAAPDLKLLCYLVIEKGQKKIDLNDSLLIREFESNSVAIKYSIKPNSKYKFYKFRADQGSQKLALKTDSLNNIKEIPYYEY